MVEVGCPSCGKELDIDLDQREEENLTRCCEWVFLPEEKEKEKIDSERIADEENRKDEENIDLGFLSDSQNLLVYSGKENRVLAIKK